MLYKETVSPTTLELLNKLIAEPLLKDFFLVGGTALSLQIGHRMSIDLDLFTTCCIEQMSEIPISGCRKLLEIYAEVLSVNKSQIINERVISRLTAWESAETLKRVIQKLKK